VIASYLFGTYYIRSLLFFVKHFPYQLVFAFEVVHESFALLGREVVDAKRTMGGHTSTSDDRRNSAPTNSRSR
jgi:hypothetical protein